MNVERPRYNTPMHENFFKACANAGLVENPDFNNWDRPQVRRKAHPAQHFCPQCLH